jgi:tight adherence protein C
MPMTVILAAAAVASAIPIAWLAVASGRRVSVGGSAGGLTDIHQIALSESALGRVIQPLGRALARRARALTPKAWVERLERRISLAGKAHSWPVERILAIKLLLAVLPTALALLFPPFDQRLWFLVVLGTFVAYVLPDAVLDSAARERQLTMQRRLPDILDQITMSVEAGLGFEASLGRAAKSSGGPLAAEFTRTLQEMQLGSPRREALKALAHRVEVADVRTFVFAVNQAETYGIPIADILRLQASELRNKRHMRAEEAALKIPVKIIFPLAFCVFPTLFIVLLGPAAMRIFQVL